MGDAEYGSLRVSTLNGVKVYNVSGGKSVPEWISEKKKRALRKDQDFLRRIELIQDLEFRVAATQLKLSRDGKFLVASGVYPPQVRVFELAELSLKFERNLEAEVVDLEILTDDYSKLAFLCADRSVCFHARFGAYFKTRIPRMGRAMAYDRASCDLLCAASSPQIYRINLEQGQFVVPLESKSPAVNCLDQRTVLCMAYWPAVGRMGRWSATTRVVARTPCPASTPRPQPTARTRP